SDLDSSTKAVIAKGERNVEILKQNRYSPVSIENQIAIIFLGTSGLLSKIQVKDVIEFEEEYLEVLASKNKDVLELLKQGKIDDRIRDLLREVAKSIEPKYLKQ
ncbi:MAG: F0F1 ATP synthase subunit alpha, partial [Bacteroidetes bacterium]|nr:F0F1 ATP synthase subunit alpha [Bacteroidota bacterium]